ncbi:hypothetical protein M2650_05825 [Luteimonas sp. SX5]|uniref:VCBS repeat-containing protein n=1 Tax=Luteimonas galliterrae TaxID=2940486 RepID=A0ABT0MIP0_9GAMM|nr:hypothetical protein [Luteimonas galliterrae]MCL1634150.1 hypothetical protein [Luteimonas galliterrae]
MRTNPVVMALLIVCASATAQDAGDAPPVRYPTLQDRATPEQGFVPKGWRLEYAKRGDLDADGRDDLLMVLRMQDPKNVLRNEGLGQDPFDTNPRILAAAFAADGGYRLAFQNHTLIPRPDSSVMDDYLGGADALKIARGAFQVTLHAFASAGSWGMGSTTFTFRYQAGCFRLIGYDDDNIQRNTGETTDTSVNFITGKAIVRTGNIEHDKTKAKTHALGKRPLLCIDEVGDGFGFDPNVPDG